MPPARILWKDAGTGVRWAVVGLGGSATRASAGLALAKITGHAGTASPYTYSGAPVAYDGSGDLAVGHFGAADSGDDLFWKLINLAEIGPGGVGVAPIPTDSVVACFALAGGYFGFTASNYPGDVPVIMYRAHDRILRKATDLDHGGPAVFRLGISGPNFLDAENRPNWQSDKFTLSSREKLSDFIATEWSNDGGCPAQAVRELIGYARTPVVPVVARGHWGAGLATPWYHWMDRVGWAPHGDWKPDDWDATHQNSEDFHPPWPYLDCSPLEKLHGYPWCEPAVFYGWWANYINCVNPPCIQHGPQNPWGVNCPECAQLGLKRLGGFLVGVVYLTIEFGGQAEETSALSGGVLAHAARSGRAS